MSRVGVSDGLREEKVMDISSLKEAQLGGKMQEILGWIRQGYVGKHHS